MSSLWHCTPGVLSQEEDLEGMDGSPGEQCGEHIRTCVGRGKPLGSPNQELGELLLEFRSH